MPYGGADDTRATSELPAALLEARRRNAAAQSRQAWVLAAPVFPQARDRADWLVAAEAALLLARASGNLRDQAEDFRAQYGEEPPRFTQENTP